MPDFGDRGEICGTELHSRPHAAECPTPSPVITLALETSTPHGSVALHDGVTEIFAERFVADRGHSSLLFPLLQRALQVAKPEQLVVGLGPGSYAGVRIAIASAMGLELALSLPLVGIPSVAALAEGKYVAVGDARRETFYWTAVEDGVCLEGPLLVAAEEFRARLTGVGAKVCATEPLASVPQAQVVFPEATTLARLAAQGRGIVARGMLEPIYLREPHITKPKAR